MMLGYYQRLFLILFAIASLIVGVLSLLVGWSIGSIIARFIVS